MGTFPFMWILSNCPFILISSIFRRVERADVSTNTFFWSFSLQWLTLFWYHAHQVPIVVKKYIYISNLVSQNNTNLLSNSFGSEVQNGSDLLKLSYRQDCVHSGGSRRSPVSLRIQAFRGCPHSFMAPSFHLQSQQWTTRSFSWCCLWL